MMYWGTMRTFTVASAQLGSWWQQLRPDKTNHKKNDFLWPNWPGQARASGLTSQWVITGSLPDIWTILCGFVARRSHIGLNYPVSNQSEKLSPVLHPICNGGRWSMKLNICSIHFISCQGMIVISVIQVQECGRYYTGGTGKLRGNSETSSYCAMGWRDALLLVALLDLS